jgi:hypothetical protein
MGMTYKKVCPPQTLAKQTCPNKRFQNCSQRPHNNSVVYVSVRFKFLHFGACPKTLARLNDLLTVCMCAFREKNKQKEQTLAIKIQKMENFPLYATFLRLAKVTVQNFQVPRSV